ncbi:MAG: 16S rRNA (guanine(966)-N(2))-methyltransferase RsmD [Acetobacteraceae bacterium]|nr:16S rRNA (guanine(966)-N(2))-methyltransferase RsmD [Pseudomonadota bacterium]
MRIVAGAWRGRNLAAPPGQATRPTADRVRQALFDMLLHAPWGGRAVLEGAVVLDAFAGTGAMGLEALSRGAATCVFFECDPAALRALRANIAACKAEGRSRVIAADVFTSGSGEAATLAFLDPPYGQDLVPRAVAHLGRLGWLAPGALIVAETGRDEDWLPDGGLLAERAHGAARIIVYRLPGTDSTAAA